MCGICGYFNLKDGLGDNRPGGIIKAMLGRLVHRGPYDEGVFEDGHVCMGMRRLSIIDIKGGHQPQFNEDRSIAVIFNGEIYNYRELKGELESRGHVFQSQSDTEILPHLYEEYGDDFVSGLNGMFAIALYDSKQRRMLLVRDRMGIKPLYYAQDGENIAFASEIRSLREVPSVSGRVCFEALDSYFAFEYVSAPLTIYRDIKKMLPGEMIRADKQGRENIRYWHPVFEKNEHDEKYLIEKIREIFFSSVKYRMISDVPLGVFLSGGVDSSLITGVMSQYEKDIKSFSIGFEEETFNELGWAKEASDFFHTQHCAHLLEESRAIELIPGILESLDQPLADASIIPTYLVCMLSRPHVTVALSGDGGDELFLGYDTYKAYRIASFLRWMPGMMTWMMGRAAGLMPVSEKRLGFEYRLKKFLKGLALRPEYANYAWWGSFAKDEKERIYSERFMNIREGFSDFAPVDFYSKYLEDIRDPLDRVNFLDLHLYLQDDLLQKVDNMSMANSLEVRVPFLDHRMVQLAVGINNNLRLRGLKTKHILKKALDDYLPEGIKNRPKIGFDIPLDKWLRGGLRGFMEKSLDRDIIEETGLFSYEGIKKLADEHLERKKNHRQLLWPLIIFFNYYRQGNLSTQA